MLNNNEQHKIKAFTADKVMSNAVKKVLMEVFIKDSGTTDVQTLASEKIAILLLQRGFKELKKYSNIADQEVKKIIQVGL